MRNKAMTTTTLEHPPTESGEVALPDVCASFAEIVENTQSKSGFYREAVRAVAEHFAAPYAAIRITRSTSTLDERVASEAGDRATWESAVENALLESQAENTPIARLFAVEGTPLQVAVLTAPICERANCPKGTMSVVARCDDASMAKVYLGEFAALVALVANHARQIGAPQASASQDDSALKRAVVKATDFQSLHELAFAVTNSLKNKFGCDQVVLGQVDRRRVRILSISGLDNVYPKSPGVKPIRQAMEECLDHGDVICCQDEDKWSEKSVATHHRLHRQWHEGSGNVPVVSVPLLVGRKCVGVLSMIRSRKSPFSGEELAQIREMVTPFAPAMMLVAKADRGLPRHAADNIARGASWLCAPGTYRRKAIAAAMLAGAAYFCFASIGYEITVPSRITPAEVRYFASPFEGTVEACHVDVGDRVVRGQLLFEMDATDLQLQRDKLKSDMAVMQLRVNQALAAEDVKSAALAGAEMRVVRAELATTLHNLAAARVRAASDGTVVSGRLSKRIGEVVPMGEPLMEFVPKGDWSIELLVPETTAAELKAGFQGRFACTARPGEPLDCTIVRIRPSSEPLEGKNVFIAEATVVGNPAWMRAGMQGMAQIDAGERRVWWVTLHRIIDYLRLTLWL